MKKVILDHLFTSVYLNDIAESTPIFVKKDEKLIGMMVHEPSGWIVRVGGTGDANGHFECRRELMETCITDFKYEFFVEN